jgi:hypothetical protein
LDFCKIPQTLSRKSDSAKNFFPIFTIFLLPYDFHEKNLYFFMSAKIFPKLFRKSAFGVFHENRRFLQKILINWRFCKKLRFFCKNRHFCENQRFAKIGVFCENRRFSRIILKIGVLLKSVFLRNCCF